ncbi:Tetracyclin repressor, C-terminal all-alpha domain [Parafrankia irregularis]|uniref:Tetracyclin repressor, C-terminal all-alpha domain n=1 Tax=Parafrankia irregularis TaxID=795642 RepID=A0A0S4QMR6_9ACTN|nr:MULTISPECIES: TetR/AcrR family transcriptional regulator C-terminal domain-containing protein [Parafrankia]MBE3200587.1 TetR/AcrR family transcriptional regulator C-terminal domain-containing protein [Parafrankia sp. CH37]CUU56919.1 Tetracyclin repressor, C-terminal all-alpha domain [Parafrankia irregularis]
MKQENPPARVGIPGLQTGEDVKADSTSSGPRNVTPAVVEGSSRRRAGRPARISRQMVVDAAAALTPANVTIQAVADRLGVDRKAVSYYVSGREELLELITAQTLAHELEHLALPTGDWRDAVRVYARGVRRVLLREASLSLLITRLPGAGVLMPAEALVDRLVDGGFDEGDAMIALNLVTRMVFANAKDILVARHFGEHPTVTEVRRALAELPAEQVPHLRRVLRDGVPQPFELELDFVVAGLQYLRDRHDPPDRPGHRSGGR